MWIITFKVDLVVLNKYINNIILRVVLIVVSPGLYNFACLHFDFLCLPKEKKTRETKISWCLFINFVVCAAAAAGGTVVSLFFYTP